MKNKQATAYIPTSEGTYVPRRMYSKPREIISLEQYEKLQEEIQRLKQEQRKIEDFDYSEMDKKDLWLISLGWLDLQAEIDIIKDLISSQED